MLRQHRAVMQTPERIALLLAVLSLNALAVVDDDLFTGVNSPQPQAKARRDPSSSEWDRLIEAADGPPIQLPETTRSEEQLRIQRREWWKKNAFDAEVARSKGKPDEQEVRDFFNELIPWFSNTGIPVPDAKNVKRCMEIAAGAVRRPAMDFIAGRFLVTHKHEADGVKLMRTVADSPADAVLPSLARAIAQAEVLHWCDIHDKAAVPAAEAHFYELFERHLAEPRGDDETEVLMGYHLDAPIASLWKGREERCFAFYKNSKLPDWARFTLGGSFEVMFGWIEIGQGRNPVTDQKKIENFAARYERARELLKEGWRLRPQSRWAAREMIYVIRHGHGGEDDTLRLWVDRALAACCDYAYAADAFLHASGPRWGGGGYAETLAFGRACAETKRYDSELPAFLNRTIGFIATNLDDWRSIYRSSKFSTLLLDTREKCMAGAKTDRGKLLQLSYLFYESWACGDYERANKALLSLPRGENGGPVTDAEVLQLTHRLNVDELFPMHDTVLRAGPARELYEKGVASLAAGHPAEARVHFEGAIEPAGKAGAKFLDAQIALTKFQEQFDAGKWATITLNDRLLWHYSEGGMEWLADEKHARLTSTWEFGKILFRGALGDSYEVRGHFRPTRVDENKKSSGLSVFCGYSPDTCGRALTSWWVGRVDTRNSTQMSMDFAPMFGGNSKLKQTIAFNKDSVFLMRRDKGRITFVCGGKQLETDFPADVPSGPCAFGIGVIGSPGISYTDVWDFEARKITDANRAQKPLVCVKPKEDEKSDAAASVAAAPAENAKPSPELLKSFLGEWRFSWDQNGWSAIRTFKEDGTFTYSESKEPGHWELSGEKILIHYGKSGTDEMCLPLDPNGTKVIGKKKRVLSAVKEKQ